MDKKELEVTKFDLVNNANNEKALELSLKINTTAYDWLKDIAKIKPRFVPETVESSEWFDKAQKKQIEAMNNITRNSMQCCMPKHSLCDTCRKEFVCPMPHIEHREKCGLYEPLPNPLDEIVNENTTRSLYPIKEENNMEAWEQVEKTRAEAEANAWKDRLKAEYAQTKERYEKLRKFNIKQDINHRIGWNEGMSPKEYRKCDIRIDIMHKQEQIMKEYLRVLEERMVLEEIEL